MKNADLLTGVPKIQILNSAEKKHFVKDDIKIRQRPLKGKFFFQYIFILWPFLSLPPHEATRFGEICCKSLEPSVQLCICESGASFLYLHLIIKLNQSSRKIGSKKRPFLSSALSTLLLACFACLPRFTILNIPEKESDNSDFKGTVCVTLGALLS